MTDTGHGHGTDGVHTGKAHSARMYDYFLNGKDHYPVDAEAAEQVLKVLPDARRLARANRGFMRRAARHLARQGIRQFLDVGTGIPTEPNLHQVVQEIAPDARIVYVDNDPVVLRHAEALLRGTRAGRTEYVQADVREPAKIVAEAREVLDFREPVALSLVALLHFLPDEAEPQEVLRTLLEPLPSGSVLMLAHGTGDFDPEALGRVTEIYRASGMSLRLRDRTEVSALFQGLELAAPGVVPLEEWDFEPEGAEVETAGVPVYVGLARKP
ncbi:SAM-dependent methyltransferase [Streptomyces sp. NPDC017979]|uniref:SAM-dependent methyltransferase n=1 Tax=Streptomyces sp. NPDC017979 TaxID=3365024 RepID=UPI0037A95A71